MKKCRDCPAKIPNGFVLCPACKERANEKRKLYKIQYAKDYKNKPPSTKNVHKCFTENCTNQITGKRVYCTDCRKLRYRATQKERDKSPYDHTPKRTTGMAWMDNFTPWMQSGKSYAEFQKGEWLARQ